MLGAGLSAASLLLAWSLARQITRPIGQLRQAFADASVAPVKLIAMAPPEIWSCRTRCTGRRLADKVEPGLLTALSKLERELALREEAQAALAQAQRLEAIGQLAGGVAHDFNNVLAAISANLDAVTLRSTDEKIRKVMQDAMDAIQMGVSLTRRLLILSRQHEVGQKSDWISMIREGTIALLRRTLGEQVTVSWKLSPDPCQIMANPGDVDNAILKLAINARNPLPAGGMLTIGPASSPMMPTALAASPMPGPAST